MRAGSSSGNTSSNCNSHGHGAWDRECPTFKQKKKAYESRSEDSKYRFFPTEDPLTWETLNEHEQNPAQLHMQQLPHPIQADLPRRPLSPPPQERGNATRANNHQRMTHKDRNPNLVPLGRQTRVDQWFTPSQTPRSQPSPANTGSEQYAQYDTGSLDSDLNNPSGWK